MCNPTLYVLYALPRLAYSQIEGVLRLWTGL